MSWGDVIDPRTPVYVKDRERDMRLSGLRVTLENLGLLPSAEPLDPLQRDAPRAPLREGGGEEDGLIDGHGESGPMHPRSTPLTEIQTQTESARNKAAHSLSFKYTHRKGKGSPHL